MPVTGNQEIARVQIADVFALLCSCKKNLNELHIFDAIVELQAAIRKVQQWMVEGKNEINTSTSNSTP